VQAHDLIEEGAEKGFVTTDHAEELLSIFRRIEHERLGVESQQWEPTRLAKELRADTRAPKAARDAVGFAASDLTTESLQDAQLLISELVANSVVHGSPNKNTRVGIVIDVDRQRLRVEVTDAGEHAPQLSQPHDTGGYGLQLVDRLASRWETTQVAAGNLTWFELDLSDPGTMPERR
jgi:anti-sigma regulatory factor (Ser/Thr protein kinase)